MRKKERKKCSLACLLLQCVSSIAEWKTSKLQSTATKTVALSSQPASKDFLNYQQCTGRLPYSLSATPAKRHRQCSFYEGWITAGHEANIWFSLKSRYHPEWLTSNKMEPLVSELINQSVIQSTFPQLLYCFILLFHYSLEETYHLLLHSYSYQLLL